MDEKMTDLELIKTYQKMKSVKEICTRLGLDSSNLCRGKSTKINEKKVAKIVKCEIIRMYNILRLEDAKSEYYEVDKNV